MPWSFDLVLPHSDLLLLLVEALLVQLPGLFLVLIASNGCSCRKGPGVVCLESQPVTSRERFWRKRLLQHQHLARESRECTAHGDCDRQTHTRPELVGEVLLLWHRMGDHLTKRHGGESGKSRDSKRAGFAPKHREPGLVTSVIWGVPVLGVDTRNVPGRAWGPTFDSFLQQSDLSFSSTATWPSPRGFISTSTRSRHSPSSSPSVDAKSSWQRATPIHGIFRARDAPIQSRRHFIHQSLPAAIACDKELPVPRAPRAPRAPRPGDTRPYVPQERQKSSSKSTEPRPCRESNESYPTKKRVKMDAASDSSGSSPGASSLQARANKAPRADRPCDICRKRKSRCAKEPDQDRCVLCTFHNRECTYNDAPQPRRKRPDLADDTPGSVDGLGDNEVHPGYALHLLIGRGSFD